MPCSRAPRRGIEDGEGAVHSLPPPTILAGPRLELAIFRYESDSLPLGHDIRVVVGYQHSSKYFILCLTKEKKLKQVKKRTKFRFSGELYL